MSSEPRAISELQPLTPPALERTAKKCLAKEPDGRWQSASDLCEELKWIAGGGSSATSSVAQPSGWRWGVPLALTAAVSVLAAFVLGWLLRPSPPSSPRPAVKLLMSVAPAEQLMEMRGIKYPLTRTSMAFSPDGRHLVYSGSDGEDTHLYLRPIDAFEGTPISGTEGAVGPFFSQDGDWVAFWADSELRRTRLDGGPPERLLNLADPPVGASWGPDDSIVFGQDEGPIVRISADGGAPEAITTLKGDEESHHHPWFLPGGKAFLYTAGKKRLRGNDIEEAKVVVQSLETGERRILIENAADGRYVPTGHIVFARLGTLMAAPFDLDSSRIELENRGRAGGHSPRCSTRHKLQLCPCQQRIGAVQLFWDGNTRLCDGGNLPGIGEPLDLG